MSGNCDIAPDMWISSPDQLKLWPALSPETAGNSGRTAEEQRRFSLFLPSPNRRELRISAEKRDFDG
jgi:hypothetical protein